MSNEIQEISFNESAFDKVLAELVSLSLSKKQLIHKVLVMATCSFFMSGKTDNYRKALKVLREDSATSQKTIDQVSMWLKDVVGLKLTIKGNDLQFKRIPSIDGHTYDKHHLVAVKANPYFEMKIAAIAKEYSEYSIEKILETTTNKIAVGISMGEIDLEASKLQIEALYGAILKAQSSEKVTKAVAKREEVKATSLPKVS